MRKYKWAIKKSSTRQTPFPKHRKWELAVTVAVPICFWELFPAFTGGLLLVSIVFQTFASFSKEQACLGCFLLRDSLWFCLQLAALKNGPEHFFGWCWEAPVYLSGCRAAAPDQELSVQWHTWTVGHQRGQTGDGQAALSDPEETKAQALWNEGQRETALQGTVDGNSQDGEDLKCVISGNSSLPRSWPVCHLLL